MKKHSRPVPATDILNSIAVDDELGVGGGSGPASNATGHTAASGGSGSKDQVDFVSIHHFPEEIQTDLIQIAEWLNLNDHDEFMNIYAKVRGQVTKKSLDQLREHQLGGGGLGVVQESTSPGATRKPSAAGQTPVEGGAFGTPSGGGVKKVSRIQSTINRRISSISTRVAAETVLRTRRSVIGFSADGHGAHHGHGGEDAISDHEVESFCLSVSALQKLMASEQVCLTLGYATGYTRFNRYKKTEVS